MHDPVSSGRSDDKFLFKQIKENVIIPILNACVYVVCNYALPDSKKTTPGNKLVNMYSVYIYN